MRGKSLSYIRSGTAFILCLFIFCLSVSGQTSTGDPVSIKDMGMGRTGLTRTGAFAATGNPATLAFADCRYGAVSFYPGAPDVEDEYGVVKLRATGLAINLNRLFGPWLGQLNAVLVYDQVGWTALRRDYSWEEYIRSYSLGVGYSGAFDVSGGLSVKWVSIEDGTAQIDARLADAGLFVRYPGRSSTPPEATYKVKFRPSMSLGVVHNGFIDSYAEGESRYFERWHLGKGTQIGVSGELRWGAAHHSWLSATVVYESSQNNAPGAGTDRFGLEFGMVDAVFFRFGDPDISGTDVNTSHGLTISTRGFRKILGGRSQDFGADETGVGRYLVNNLNVEFTWARTSADDAVLPGTDYYQIDISL